MWYGAQALAHIEMSRIHSTNVCKDNVLIPAVAAFGYTYVWIRKDVLAEANVENVTKIKRGKRSKTSRAFNIKIHLIN